MVKKSGLHEIFYEIISCVFIFGICVSGTILPNISFNSENIKKVYTFDTVKDLNDFNKIVINKYNEEVIERPLNPAKRVMNVEIIAKRNFFQLIVDAYPTYTSKENMSGCHLFTLHPQTSRLMLHRHYPPDLPLQGESLASTIRRIQPGRVILLTVAPGNTSYLIGAEELFIGMGSIFIGRLAAGEILLTSLFNDTAQETLIRKRLHKEDETLRGTYVSVHMVVIVPSQTTPRCQWYTDNSLKLQANFCDSYEGMKETCQCNSPPIHTSNRIIHDEVQITPLIIISTQGATLLHKLIRKIEILEGYHLIKLLIVMAVNDTESIKVAKLLGVDYIIIQEVIPSTLHLKDDNKLLLNMTTAAFNHFPFNEKFIVIQDGSIPSLDILSFFHDTSWLLDEDPSIDCISAYNPNSFKILAKDPTKIYRGELYPRLAFMTRKSWIIGQKESLDKQLSPIISKQINAVTSSIYPQVSRIAPDIEAMFDRTLYKSYLLSEGDYVISNKMDIMLRTEHIPYQKYWNNLLTDIITGLIVTNISCDYLKLSYSTVPKIIYVTRESPNTSTEFSLLSYLFACLNIWSFNSSVQFEDVVSISYNKQIIHIIICPASIFCRYCSSNSYWKLNSAAEHDNLEKTIRLMNNSRITRRIRLTRSPIMKTLELSDFTYLML